MGTASVVAGVAFSVALLAGGLTAGPAAAARNDICPHGLDADFLYRAGVPEVDACLAAGADVNAVDDYGTTPLTSELANFGRADVTAALLEAGADPNLPSEGGSAPLHYALLYEDALPLVTLLLDAGADANLRDVTSWTPLHYAASFAAEDRAAVIDALLAAGADPNLRGEDGDTPLLWAAGSGSAAMVRALLAGGAEPNVWDNYGQRPLHQAAATGEVESVTALLESGAALEAPDEDGWTALHFAVSAQNEGTTARLLEAGADPNARDSAGWTPLHQAASEGESEIVFLLLDAGADPAARTNQGETPLDVIPYFHQTSDAYARLLDLSDGVLDGVPVPPTPEAVPGGEIDRLVAAADPSEGAHVFRMCSACHTAEFGAGHRIGPNLWGIVDRPIAAAEGYSYSSALTEYAGRTGTWTLEALDAFTQAPRTEVPGTLEAFRGVRDLEDRLNLLAYLATLRE